MNLHVTKRHLNHIETRNSIQAYLKNRENKPSISTVSSAKSDLHISDTTESLSDSSPNTSNSGDLLDQHDFTYSQKLFHISDGNLYSVFSPIQGRSYGMKPSFLRKQKYTVQESNGRGRRNVRKGLKFHNFIPSESVTSEKDNSFLQSKWKVHSECRLKEEHGTKQITISNWSQSVQSLSKTQRQNETCPVETSVSADSSPLTQQPFSTANAFSCDFTQQNNFTMPDSSPRAFKECTVTANKQHDASRSSASKKDSLDFVLNSLYDRPATSKNAKTVYDHPRPNSLFDNQKHRRKPIQTRRVVPYVKYLSIMEEKDDVLPLDLSSKYSSACHLNTDFSISGDSSSENESALPRTPESSFRDKLDANSSFTNQKTIPPQNQNLFPNSSLASLLQSKTPTPLMLLAPSTSNFKPGPSQEFVPNMSANFSASSRMKPLKLKPPPYPINQITNPLMLNKQFIQQTAYINKPSKARRRNQRSVIKQKLEDTFRQNGFLVKTKQVSDGEATFCKFRQLRKYTRYYLKSWQQHLPDEVHKMWKGFLPPKSILPSLPDTDCETINDAPCESNT